MCSKKITVSTHLRSLQRRCKRCNSNWCKSLRQHFKRNPLVQGFAFYPSFYKGMGLFSSWRESWPFYPKMCPQRWQSSEAKVHKTPVIILQAGLEHMDARLTRIHQLLFTRFHTRHCGLLIKWMGLYDSLPDHFMCILNKESKKTPHLSNSFWNSLLRLQVSNP